MNNMILAEISFEFPNEEKKLFTLNHVPDLDVNSISPVAKESNESFEYSGRHDTGILPVLNSSSSMSKVISAIRETRNISDSYLTERINQIYGYSSNKETKNEGDDVVEGSSTKKPKLEEV